MTDAVKQFEVNINVSDNYIGFDIRDAFIGETEPPMAQGCVEADNLTNMNILTLLSQVNNSLQDIILAHVKERKDELLEKK